MLDSDREAESFTNEQLEVLEQQQAELDEAMERQDVSKLEYERLSAKVAFQIAQINDRNQQAHEQHQSRSTERHFERSRDLFGD